MKAARWLLAVALLRRAAAASSAARHGNSAYSYSACEHSSDCPDLFFCATECFTGFCDADSSICQVCALDSGGATIPSRTPAHRRSTGFAGCLRSLCRGLPWDVGATRSRRRDCHLMAPPCTFSRRFNRDKQGVSSKCPFVGFISGSAAA